LFFDAQARFITVVLNGFITRVIILSSSHFFVLGFIFLAFLNAFSRIFEDIPSIH